jgi:hypothetical protein
VTAADRVPSRTWLGRERLRVVLGVYGAFLAVVLLWPRGSFPSGVVVRVAEALSDWGLPASMVAGSRVEFALNALMVMPLVGLAALVWPRWRWERWTAYAFVGSCAVELLQGLLLPMRSAQFADVVANTLGAAAGAVIGRVIGSSGR